MLVTANLSSSFARYFHECNVESTRVKPYLQALSKQEPGMAGFGYEALCFFMTDTSSGFSQSLTTIMTTLLAVLGEEKNAHISNVDQLCLQRKMNGMHEHDNLQYD